MSYGYAGLFKTLASINDKPARFEILIPLIHTLVRDNVKLKNDVFEELDKYMLDYEKNDPKMKKIPSSYQRMYNPDEKYCSLET